MKPRLAIVLLVIAAVLGALTLLCEPAQVRPSEVVETLNTKEQRS